MSGFLLDTNVPSELVHPQPEPKVKSWVASRNLDTLFISALNFGEIRKGIVLRSPGCIGISAATGGTAPSFARWPDCDDCAGARINDGYAQSK